MKLFSLWCNNIISIDIGSFETKIIQGVKEKENINIKKAFCIETPIEAYKNGYIKNKSELINVINEELKKNKIKTAPCYLSIKSTSIITREIDLPVLDNKEIDGLLKYQLPEYLPMDYSKYMVQHKVINKSMDNDKEKLNVMVVAIPKDMVDMHYDFVRELGLKPAVLDYQPNCAWKLFTFSNCINDIIDTTGKTIAAIDLGYDSTNVTIINKGKIQATRVIDMGGITLDNNTTSLIAVTRDELVSLKSNIEDVNLIDDGFTDYNRYVNIIRTSIEGIIGRIDRIFKFYLSKDINNEIETLVLYGGLSNINGVDKLFSNYFGIPTIVLNKLNKINSIIDFNKYINCIGSLIRDDEV